MGIYNIYNGIQLKVGIVDMIYYKVGDKVAIPDGIYVGYEGIAIIDGGKLRRTYDYLIDKWGNEIKCKDVIAPNNPISKAIKKKGNNDS